MRRVTAFAFALAAAGVVLTPASAHAQSDFERQEAQARFDEGNRLYGAGRYEEARVKFTQAWATLKRPNVLFNLARAEQQSGKLVEAARHFRRYERLSANDPKVTDAQRKEARDHLGEIDARVGRLAVKAPAGAIVTIDGENVEAESLADAIEVAAGKHLVTATVGANKRDADAQASAGAVTPVTLAFEEQPAAPAGSDRVAPPVGGNEHVVEPPPATSERTFWDTPRWIGVGLAGAGVAAVIAGIVFGSASSSKADHADEIQRQLGASGCSASPPPAACSDLSDSRSAQDRDATLSKIFLVGGIAATAIGAALVVWPRSHATVTPSAGPSGAGLSLSGTF